jgi:hypothetical protein
MRHGEVRYALVLGVAIGLFCTLEAVGVFAPVVVRAAVESGAVALPSCDDGLLTACIDTVSVNKSLVGASSQFIGSPIIAGSSLPATFTSAFDAWDVANGGDWTLVNGARFNLSINAYVGADAGQHGWTRSGHLHD